MPNRYVRRPWLAAPTRFGDFSVRKTSHEERAGLAASLAVVALLVWGLGGRVCGQTWQAGPGGSDPGWFPAERMPWGNRSVPQGPQAPTQGPRPATWPGSPTPAGTAPNGDTVLGLQPTEGERAEGDRAGGGWRLAGPAAAGGNVAVTAPRSAPQWGPERHWPASAEERGIAAPAAQGAGWAPGLSGGVGASGQDAARDPSLGLGPRTDRFSFPADEPAPVLFERAEALARVGTEVILAAEVMAGLEEVRAEAIARLREAYGGRVPPEQLAQLDQKLKEVIRHRLEQKVQVALIVQHAARSIPAENLKRVREIAGREFERQELPRMMKAAEVRSRRELEDKLLAAGMSLEARKREWVDQVLAADWLRQQVRPSTAVSHEELLHYYHEHLAEFEHPARVRWEQLMVRVPNYPSRDAARAALAAMGNEVLRGVPFADVARSKSEGPTASQGGLRDWTSQGSLTSEVLDRALFGLPVGQLSPILEEDKVMHIVRVIERREAERTPFTEAQVEIRERIRKEREAAAREAFLAKLRREIPVWTAFDHEVAAQAPRPSLIR